jgi:enoyl-CoA hydratase/carnithine racemase
MSELVTVERRRGGVAWVTLNRPDARNALSRDVNARLVEIGEELHNADDVRAVVLTGAGEHAFSAGADLKERRDVPADEAGVFVDAISAAIETWARIHWPTIAAMNGSAFGGGLELAMACDFRVIVEGAEVGLTEVRLGIMPGAGGTQRLPRLVGEARAKEMIMLGRRIPATRAYEFGLVQRVVPRAGFAAAIDELLAELGGCAPMSTSMAKSAIERGLDLPLQEGLQMERELYDITLNSADRNEGLAAFAEKRPPKFQGR